MLENIPIRTGWNQTGPYETVMPRHQAVQLHTRFHLPHKPPPAQRIEDDLPVVLSRTSLTAVRTDVGVFDIGVLTQSTDHRIDRSSNGIDKGFLCVGPIEDPGLRPLTDDFALRFVLGDGGIKAAALRGLWLDLLNLKGVGEVVVAVDESDEGDFEPTTGFAVACVEEEAESVGLLSHLSDEGLIHDGDQFVLVDAGGEESLSIEGGKIKISLRPSILGAGTGGTMSCEVGSIGSAREREEGREHRQHELQLGLGKTGKTSENLCDESHLGTKERRLCRNSHLSLVPSSIHDLAGFKTDRTIGLWEFVKNDNQ